MINLFHDRHGFECWLDTDGGQKDGLCIGTGPTAQEALEIGLKTLEGAKAEIQASPEIHYQIIL